MTATLIRHRRTTSAVSSADTACGCRDADCPHLGVQHAIDLAITFRVQGRTAALEQLARWYIDGDITYTQVEPRLTGLAAGHLRGDDACLERCRLFGRYVQAVDDLDNADPSDASWGGFYAGLGGRERMEEDLAGRVAELAAEILPAPKAVAA